MSIRHRAGPLFQVAHHLLNTRNAKEDRFYDRFIVSLFQRTAREVCMWAAQRREAGDLEDLFASVQGIINPSDGHPQEEHVPDFGWFRPLSQNNTTWVLYWPELEV